MSAALSLQYLKTWCRVDGNEFDDLMLSLADIAVKLASHETGRDFTIEPLPEPVQAWIAAQVAYWLDNPAASTEKQMLPSPFHRGLLDPYRTWL